MKYILFATLLFASCMSKSKLAQRCATEFPCTETSTVIVTTKLDTIYQWQELPPLPLVGIRCFEWNGKESIEIFRVPCTCVNKTIEKAVYFEDSTKIYFLSTRVAQLQKDSVNQRKAFDKLNFGLTNKAYFYKIGFWVLSLVVVLLAGFLIYRLTRK